MDKPKIGDVVYLNSGSIAMTIVTVDGKNCQVTWHDKESKKHYATYPQEALTKENPNKPVSKQF